MSGQDDERFLERAKRRFDESVERIDGQTQSRLNRGRQKALAELASRGAFPGVSTWVPAAGVAAAAVVAVVLWNGNGPVVPSAPAATDLEILMDEDALEMLEELEFYGWMDLDQEAGANVG
ncbi:MAG: hypothetical protein ACREQZ_11655 [Woeseiaceae bacterium]